MSLKSLEFTVKGTVQGKNRHLRSVSHSTTKRHWLSPPYRCQLQVSQSTAGKLCHIELHCRSWTVKQASGLGLTGYVKNVDVSGDPLLFSRNSSVPTALWLYNSPEMWSA